MCSVCSNDTKMDVREPGYEDGSNWLKIMIEDTGRK
jgi:hypothetical protein